MTSERQSRGRSDLVAVLGILACIAITISATTLWVHQTALNTDRYVSVVSRVAADPAVIEEVSTNLAKRITDGVVDRVDVPPVIVPLLESWLQEQVASFMESEAFGDGWARANQALHSALVRILRSEAILGEEPVTISVAQLLVIAIDRLQEAGVIPGDVQLPDPSDSTAVETIRQILAERLDIEVPPGFGEITLARSERLEVARQVVRIFDVVTAISVITAVVLVALTIWLARNRLRAVLLLGIGASIALLVAAGSTSVLGGVVVNALAEAGATNTIGALVNALLGDLAQTLVVVLVIGALMTVAILYIGRQPAPAEAMAAASPYPVPWPPTPADGGSPASQAVELPVTEPSPTSSEPTPKAPPRARRKSPGPAAKSPGTAARPAPKRARKSKDSSSPT